MPKKLYAYQLYGYHRFRESDLKEVRRLLRNSSLCKMKLILNLQEREVEGGRSIEGVWKWIIEKSRGRSQGDQKNNLGRDKEEIRQAESLKEDQNVNETASR